MNICVRFGVMVLLLVCFAFMPAMVIAQGVPTSISYQGKLTDVSGTPVPDGSRSMEFKLYSASSGGTPLWDSGALNVVTTSGVFSVALGSPPTPVITSSTLSSGDVWVEVKVGTDSPLPRTKLASAPFALRAGDLTLPFSKTVSSASAPALEVKNTGANYAIKGESSNASFAGLAGLNTAGGQGVYGSTVSGSAVYGYNSGAGNVGFLASSTMGAYGSASGSGYGIYGTNSGSGPGVYGVNTGTGRAGHFKVENSGSSAPALYATTTGTGPAG